MNDPQKKIKKCDNGYTQDIGLDKEREIERKKE